MEFKNIMGSRLECSAQEFIRSRVSAAEDMTGTVLRKSLGIPFLKVDLPDADYGAMLKEAMVFEERFVDHGFDGNRGWKSLCIHGLGAEKTLSYDRYGYEGESDAPYDWTDIAYSSPVTFRWLKELLHQEFYQSFQRVRFMMLEPGGFVRLHRDLEESDSRLGPLNFALNMPEGCFWIFEKWGRLSFRAGEGYLLDVSQKHGVWNSSDQARVHIIIHGIYGSAYYRQIETQVQKMREAVSG